MPKIDLDAIPQTNASGYPPPYVEQVRGRLYRKLAAVAGIEDFGVTHVVLEPGAWSGQRHWHEGEDELVIMLSGEAVLVDDHGETLFRAGDIAAFPKGDGNGHVFQNRTDQPCVLVAIGKVAASDCHYPDIDLHLFDGVGFRRKDGSAC